MSKNPFLNSIRLLSLILISQTAFSQNPKVEKMNSLQGIRKSIFKTSKQELLVLTLNLHTYQEKDQLEKLNKIAEVIAKLDIDIIAFQECAQNKSSKLVFDKIKEDNMALLIANKIKSISNSQYYLTWDWAHYGWDVWEEGLAILSKYPIVKSDAKYISSGSSTTDITSRKVIFSSLKIQNKEINFFNTHIHWRTSLTDDAQNQQIRNINSWIMEKEADSPNSISMLCGDFNGNPTSASPWNEGYQTLTQDSVFIDTFLKANPNANQGNKPEYASFQVDSIGRIDYIFVKKNSVLEVVDSQIIFNASTNGKVSDHYAILTKFRIRE